MGGPLTSTPRADPTPTLWDPATIEVNEGTYRFRHDPLPSTHRALLHEETDHINGNPLDWALALDPHLEETIVAVRDPSRFGEPVWYQGDRRLRAETFTSPLSRLRFCPTMQLTRRLLTHTPYVLILQEEDRVRHAFDLRTIDDAKRLAPILKEHQETVLPATGPATREGHIEALIARVPYDGRRYARSTRKRFRLHVPGRQDDTSVEGVAARILTAKGYTAESPRILAALYRLLVGEVVAYWWRDPRRIENGPTIHHPPTANPLEATRRGLQALHEIEEGQAPTQIKRLGELVIQKGHRPPTYRNYINRLARLADAYGPRALAGTLEGILRGHNSHSADLIATHPALPRPLLVEVKSTGDRLRASQAQAALYHQRDGRSAYRIMQIEHTKRTVNR
jgi:hypothetical protein